MRIFIAAESFFPRSNGVTNSVIRSARYARNNGHEVRILAQGDGPIRIEDFEVVRVPALSLNKNATVDFPVVSHKRLRTVIETYAPHVIHLASPFFLGDQVRKTANELNIPVVAIYQTDVPGFASFYKLNFLRTYGDLKIRKIHANVDLNLVPSSASENYFISLGITNIKRWGRGVDLQAFNPKWRSKELRAQWGNRTIVGYVGRLAPEKQIEKLQALRDIDAQLVIIGDGPSRAALVYALPNAIFLGQLSGEALSKAIASLDVLVTTGEHETFCQVVQEGMASGLPVIAPGVGGPVDLIDHGSDGYLALPGNTESLRTLVEKLVSDELLRANMGASALNRVQNKTWDAICSELLNHYESVINRDEEQFAS